MEIKFKRVRKIMKANGITLLELAEKMGFKTPQAAFYRVKHAKKLKTIKKVANALAVNVDDIK